MSDQVSFPRGIRHGTAFAVDASVVEALIANRTYNPLIPDNVADPSVSKFGHTYFPVTYTHLTVQYICFKQHSDFPADEPGVDALNGWLEFCREVGKLHHLGFI